MNKNILKYASELLLESKFIDRVNVLYHHNEIIVEPTKKSFVDTRKEFLCDNLFDKKLAVIFEDFNYKDNELFINGNKFRIVGYEYSTYIETIKLRLN